MSQKSDATEANEAVRQAVSWARSLVQRESRGNGDWKNSVRRVAARHPGITAGLIHNLLYRAPSDMLMSKWMAVRRAYLLECERQEAALRHEREITKSTTLLGAAVVRSSDVVAGQSDRDLTDQ